MLASVVELHFSVPDDEVVRWRDEAYELGLSLTTLVRARMNTGESYDSSLLDEVILDAAREAARHEVRQATLGMSREDMLAAIRVEINNTLARQKPAPALEAVRASGAVFENGGPPTGGPLPGAGRASAARVVGRQRAASAALRAFARISVWAMAGL